MITTIALQEIEILEPVTFAGEEGFKIRLMQTGEIGFISVETLQDG